MIPQITDNRNGDVKDAPLGFFVEIRNPFSSEHPGYLVKHDGVFEWRYKSDSSADERRTYFRREGDSWTAFYDEACTMRVGWDTPTQGHIDSRHSTFERLLGLLESAH
jgi:hypothetical protein